MRLFIDTSALIKRYISEDGSEQVDNLMDSAIEIIVSPVTKIECISTIKRLLTEKLITSKEFNDIKNDILYDFQYFNVIRMNDRVENTAIKLIEKYQLKTLDAIQLSSCCITYPEYLNFVACDNKLINAANREKLTIINPLNK
jgi:hypothetical protein